MLNPTFTRLYFGDEEAANAADTVLQSVPESRRSTLIAQRVENGDSSVPVYCFDIRYQGDDETAFFDV
jgi:protocatechuate 3,4-dioxygenase alpha subunit